MYLSFKCTNADAYIFDFFVGDFPIRKSICIDCIQMRKFARVIKTHYEVIDSKSSEKDKLFRLYNLWSDVSGLVGDYLSKLIEKGSNV